jgi:hypothetical protein
MPTLHIEVAEDDLPALQTEAASRNLSVEDLLAELSSALADEYREGRALARRHLLQNKPVFDRIAR